MGVLQNVSLCVESAERNHCMMIEDGGIMTLKQIAKNNNLDYGLVYNGAREAGVLIRWTKNAEYDEIAVLQGVVEYLSKKIQKHLDKSRELIAEKQRAIVACLKDVDVDA